MSIVADKEIPRNVEVLVNYRYSLNTSPDWYRTLWRKYLLNKGWSDCEVTKYGGTAHEVEQYFTLMTDKIEKAK